MQLVLLGVGSSAGTPVIGCGCNTCHSENPKNKRTRCSAAIRLATGETLLIDTGPDLRQQALRESLHRVDAVLYTHPHADHLHGIDDLRAFCQIQKQQIPLYGNAAVVEHITSKFAYALREPSNFWDLPILRMNQVDEPFSLFGQLITPIPVKHGRVGILGYRVGNIAYVTDVSEIPDESLALLQGLDVLLLDCLRYIPHTTHIHLEQSLAYASLIKARQTYLIHMTHEMEYETLAAQLPPNVHVGYDGLRLEVA
ncbi:MAG TPA: MBL fold metallo-hydrolase [Methylophilaceae bacterium]|nr:MBL fold metallo-hydrolase [Methylophilaceae bacterium]